MEGADLFSRGLLELEIVGKGSNGMPQRVKAYWLSILVSR